MRWVLVSLTALALAAGAFAGENTGKIVKTKVAGPGDGQPFETVVNDAEDNPLMGIACSELERGEKDVKIYWLDPEHMPSATAPFYFTWGDNVEECTVEENCVGLGQFRNLFLEGQSTVTMRVVFVGHVANRLKEGSISADDFYPVANTPGQWGSVVNATGLAGTLEEGLPGPKYLDLTEYGATVSVDAQKYEATFTWKYDPTAGFIVEDGQLELGLVVVQK
jgi:hypothetical protein